MPKTRSVYICQQCGYKSPTYLGKCPQCDSWNSFVETIENSHQSLAVSRQISQKAQIIDLSKIQKTDFKRLDTGFEEFDRVLGGGIVSGSLVLVSGDPGIGKCISGSTRILDPVSGSFLPITEWEEIKRPVLALNLDSFKLLPQKVISFHDQGIKQIVEVKTRLGRILKCTLNHPLLTPSGWSQVSKLSKGVRIASPRVLPYFGNKGMSEYKVKLIAYFLSDGSSTDSMNVTNALPEVEKDLKLIAEKLGMTLRIYKKKNTIANQYRFVVPYAQRAAARAKIKKALWRVHDQVGINWQAWARAAQVNYSQLNDWRRGRTVPDQDELYRLAQAVRVNIRMFSPDARDQAAQITPVMQLLKSYGLRAIRAKQKSVPDCIFCLPKAELGIFLKTIFSCDGSLYVTSGGTPALSYSTISFQLAQDVQHLLLRFGFVAKLRTKKQQVNKKPYTAYEVQMLGNVLVKCFLDEIGIMGRESAKVKIKGSKLPSLPSTHFDTIPTGMRFWEELQYVTGGISLRVVSRQVNTTIRYRRLERPLTRQTVAAITKTYPSTYLNALAFGDVYWDEIESITPAGKERVYDLTVPGTANFVANDLIIHNSTLLTQLALNIDKTLYVAGEESARQIKIRVDRIKPNASLAVLNEVDVDVIIGAIEQFKPSLVIIDSIQTMETDDLESVAGSVGQVRESAHRLQRLAKSSHIPIFLVGHVTKEGNLAGPKTLEHVVDVVLSLEGDSTSMFKILRSTKNRFGPTDEVGVFEMEDNGMIEVKNPSKIFLDQKVNAPGSAVVCILTGIRPLLVEIQALVTRSSLAMPRRTGSGIDNNRLQLLVAVLQKRLGLSLYDQDVFVNVTGGLKVFEPAADLGICMAIASSFKDKSIDSKTVLVGEVGLLGELRIVRQLDKRIMEAKKLGFTRVISSENARNLAQALKLSLMEN